ncbi:MAG: toll/interleukin-1 receptor domain-containing protein, partial [Microcystis panniformis]
MKKSEIQIFLAHASEDKPAVLALHERLKQAGYKPWLDKKDLIPGQIWRDEIPKAIKASQIFLACLSAKSANKQGYIQRELRIALDTLG